MRLSSGCEDDNLAAGLVLLHQTMGLDNLIEMQDLADMNTQRASLDLVRELLQRRAHEVRDAAIIGRERDGCRNDFHRLEIVERPFVPDHWPPAGKRRVDASCGLGFP
jgi:hypothetical protein